WCWGEEHEKGTQRRPGELQVERNPKSLKVKRNLGAAGARQIRPPPNRAVSFKGPAPAAILLSRIARSQYRRAAQTRNGGSRAHLWEPRKRRRIDVGRLENLAGTKDLVTKRRGELTARLA